LNPVSIAPRSWIRAAGLALLAASVSLLRFTPAFVLWRGLGVPAASSDPALNRAADALGQLRHPLTFVASPNNRVIAWRLFFPLLGHGLALPAALYLALPHLGCLLVLILVARLALLRGLGSGPALAASILVATCSWFFVSTAWLAYFDSWYVLGLLLAVFAPRRAMLAAILVTPWIDERFVLTLPLCLILRAGAAADPARAARERWREAGWAAAALLPWALIRLGAYAFQRDAVSGAYARDLTPGANTPYYLLGLWEGLRWAWVPLVAGLALGWRRGRRAGSVLILAVVLTAALNLLIANDLSRSVSTLVPAVVVGILLVGREMPRLLPRMLYAAAALNLMVPAEHVVASWTEPIRPFPVEIDHARHPPPALDPLYYIQAAAALNDRGDARGAIDYLDVALQLDPRQAAAYAHRAVAYYRRGRLERARADADRAVALRPGFPEALYNRAIIRAGGHDFAGARADLEAALRAAPAAWPARAQAESLAAAWRDRAAAP